MTYAPAKFEAAMSHSLRGNAFTRNISFDLDLGWGQGHIKYDQYPRLHMTYAPAKFDVATSHG